MQPATKSLPIHVHDVTKTYGNFRALDQVSLHVERGEFITLLGPSGSGKTTLLMVIAGFVRPDSGVIRFGAREMTRTPPQKRDVGLVFQNYALFPHMNVFDNIAYPLRQRGIGRAEARQSVHSALELVRLAGFEHRRVNELSGGQKQRVALARAVVFEPPVLLMDEPLSALDKKLRDQMQIEIRNMHRRLEVTTIYVTHDQREALTMSDRIAVMNGGCFVQIDEPRHLYERPATKFVADFIGESAFLPVTARQGTGYLNGVPLRAVRPPVGSHQQYLLVRPEKLFLLSGRDETELNILQGIVKNVVYQGESFIVAVELPDGSEIAIRRPARRDTLAALPNPGAPIRLGLHPDDTIFVSDAAPAGLEAGSAPEV